MQHIWPRSHYANGTARGRAETQMPRSRGQRKQHLPEPSVQLKAVRHPHLSCLGKPRTPPTQSWQTPQEGLSLWVLPLQQRPTAEPQLHFLEEAAVLSPSRGDFAGPWSQSNSYTRRTGTYRNFPKNDTLGKERGCLEGPACPSSSAHCLPGIHCVLSSPQATRGSWLREKQSCFSISRFQPVRNLPFLHSQNAKPFRVSR